MIIPPWLAILRHWKLAAGLLAVIAAFYAGWQVRADRCAAQVAKIERAAEKQRARQQATVNRKATEYERSKTDADRTTTIREREIRTKYVPGSCDPGPDVGRVLDDALRDAAGAASGEPRPTVPEPAS